MDRSNSQETVCVPCPECGQGSMEPIDRVAALDVIPCSLCGGLIDLSASDCRSAVELAKARLTDASGRG
jgi:hypothetical protein